MRWTKAAANDEPAACGRRSRVVLAPRRWRQVREKQNFSGMMVARKPGHQGERGVSCKPLRREGRIASAEPVCSCAFPFVHFAHETAGAARTRSSLRPLGVLRGRSTQNPGASRRGNAELRRFVVSSSLRGANGSGLSAGPMTGSATKQSILSFRCAMDCFAEPVIGRAFAQPGGSQ